MILRHRLFLSKLKRYVRNIYWRLPSFYSSVAVLFACCYFRNLYSGYVHWCYAQSIAREVTLATSTKGKLSSLSYNNFLLRKPYGFRELEMTAHHLEQFRARLLVFNGTNFVVYNLEPRNQSGWHPWHQCNQCQKIIPLLVHALTELYPNRFQKGQPVFQLFFTDADYFSSKCVNPGMCSTISDFAPVLLFGSAPKNSSELPTVKGFPHFYYANCLYDFKIFGKLTCAWDENVPSRSKSWETLESRIVWRGSNFHFLNQYKTMPGDASKVLSIPLQGNISKKDAIQLLFKNWKILTPRWRAVALTLEAELNKNPWIDAKFILLGNRPALNHFQDKGIQVYTKRTDLNEMSKCKYQIDLGGWGGTSWRGTISKLGMPGVLFHHETVTQDFFYDILKPWVHYIPIRWDLSDLREKYDWAEANPKEAERISHSGTMLYHRLLNGELMKDVYVKLFVEHLSLVVEAYETSNQTWEELSVRYNRTLDVIPVGVCDQSSCVVEDKYGVPMKAVGWTNT